MTGATPAGGMTFLAASSTLKWVGGMSGSGTCLTVTTMSIVENSIKVGRGVRRTPIYVCAAGHSRLGCINQASRNDLGNIADREALLDVERAYTVFEHRHAEWAADRHAACVG